MRITSAIKVLISAIFLSTCLLSQAYSFDTKARAAYVIDQTSGTVLLSKNSDLPLPPASMSKLMTLYMTFEFIEAGGTTTDVNGSYSLDVPSDGGTLVFSFIGLVSQEVAIGARSVVDKESRRH